MSQQRKILKQSISVANNRWYTVKTLGDETGLSYFDARYDDFVVGWFMAVDLQEFSEKDPHGINWYSY